MHRSSGGARDVVTADVVLARVCAMVVVPESAVPRFSGGDTLVSAGSRSGRMARCHRSRGSRVTPPRQSSRRGLLFLNNRYHDPTTGQFSRRTGLGCLHDVGAVAMGELVTTEKRGSAISQSETAVSAGRRLGRSSRCSRSRGSRVTPPRQKLRRGVLFLNNRYHDPTTGQFISVDPSSRRPVSRTSTAAPTPPH